MTSTNGTMHSTNGRPHPAPTVLMVDDDPAVLGAMSEMLELDGCAVTTCRNGREAVRCFETLRPGVVILDIRMPELDGLSACRIIRAKSAVPILMLTALDDEWDAAHALESGADDYIRKPVGASEFVARVRAALRRSALVAAEVAEPIVMGHIVIDVLEHEVRVDGKLVELSPVELRLLTHLAMNQNHVLTHDDTLTTVWGDGYSGSRHVLRVTMSRLRQKLALTDSSSVRIRTVDGVGYRLIVPEADALDSASAKLIGAPGAAELERVQNALRESERQMRSLLDTAELSAVQLDAQGRVVYANPHMLKLLGYAHDELFGCDLIERCVPEEHQAVTRHDFARALAEDPAVRHYRNAILRSDGTSRIMAWSNTAVRDANGSVAGMISIAEDITGRNG